MATIVEISKEIVRHAVVKNGVSHYGMLASVTHHFRKLYHEKALISIPQSKGREVDVIFFQLGREVTGPELLHEYDQRGLVADPHAHAAILAADPAFADAHPSLSCWKGYDYEQRGEEYFSLFFSNFDFEGSRRPLVSVTYKKESRTYPEDLWYAGVRKTA